MGPGIGEDAAVISMSEGRVLVAKTDPITFASGDIGWYAVHVNANDIADRVQPRENVQGAGSEEPLAARG